MMKKWMMVATAVLYGLMRGMHEGMVMIMPGDPLSTGAAVGVRGHAGFMDYHLIAVVGIALTAALVAQAIWWRPKPLLIIGLVLILWEATELGYAFARAGWPIAGWEHVNFIDLVSFELRGYSVWALHIIRAAAGVYLIRKGGTS